MEERKYQVYLVTTPIGNLEEINSRSLEILNMVDMIYCEDTKHSLRLLSHYNISNPLKSMHKFNFQSVIGSFLENVENGKTIAYITDAGVPSISDPGQSLVNSLIENNISYTLVGCPCAFVNALVLSGMDASEFTFYGFLNEKQKIRNEQISKLANENKTCIIYSAVHNVDKDLKDLSLKLAGRKIALCRELTKLHEEVIFITLGEKVEYNCKGEFVIVIEGKTNVEESPKSMIEKLQELIGMGENPKDAIKQVAHDMNLDKNIVYQEYLKIK